MIHSTFRKVYQHAPTAFPEYSDCRVMMMPVNLGDLGGVPEQYHTLVEELYSMTERRHIGQVGYLTIDEKTLAPGETLRRGGKHVDGCHQGRAGAYGAGGGYGSVGNGMLTVSSTPHCRAYPGIFDGEPGPEGECEHIETAEGITFGAGDVYFVDGACVHESLPVESTTRRQFVRLSMPSNGAWYQNYTHNPTGVQSNPEAEILPSRRFMETR